MSPFQNISKSGNKRETLFYSERKYVKGKKTMFLLNMFLFCFFKTM